jgi:6-pyruvoyltetrahydropterin/6-carboxytetrahydropterin synthase
MPANNSSPWPTIRVTRRYRFSASHRLHSPELSSNRNREVYGKCNNPYGHGHDYVIDVTLRGAVDPRLGRLLGLDQLDQFVRSTIVGAFDRRDLNTDVPEFVELVPTTENLARVAAARLASAWPLAFPGSPAIPEKVRIWETKNNIFEMFVDELNSDSAHAHEAAHSAGLVKESK